MTSKQPSQQQSTPTWLIFANASFNETNEQLVRDLKRTYRGVNSISRLRLDDNYGRTINAIQIELKADTLAREILDSKKISIKGEEYAIESSTRSFVVSKIPFGENEGKLLEDLGHNYIGVQSIYRFHNSEGDPVDNIRIDCKTDTLFTKILKDKYILIGGKRRPVQPYWSLVCNPTQTVTTVPSEDVQKHVADQTQTSVVQQPRNVWTKPPQNYLSEQRIKDLFKEQQMQLEAMINEFENRWNSRLSSLPASASSKTNVDQLLPILNDLTTVCQQFNQQNAQVQRQLGSVINRVQDVQIKSTNTQAQESWPQLPLQNGH